MKKNEGTILYIGCFELPDRNAAAHRVLNNAKIFRELGYNVVFAGVQNIKNNETKNKVYGFDNLPLKFSSSITKIWSQLFGFTHYKKLLKNIRM